MVSSALPSTLDAWRDVIHPAALILPRPTPAEFADLKQSVEDHGLLSPLSTFIDKQGEHWLLDGVSRLQVMVELDRPVIDAENRWIVPTFPYYEEQGADPYEIALNLNVNRRHLTADQKREVIQALLEQRPDLSNRGIAHLAAASPHTVAAVREEHEQRQQQQQPDPQAVIDGAVVCECGHRRSWRLAPMFVVTGASGSGKTTIAERLAKPILMEVCLPSHHMCLRCQFSTLARVDHRLQCGPSFVGPGDRRTGSKLRTASPAYRRVQDQF